MQTPNRMNPATDQGKNPGRSNIAEDLSVSSPENLEEQHPQFTERAKEMVSKVTSQAQRLGKRSIEQSGSYVREYPVPTLLGCFGVGLIAGLFIGRR